LPKPKTATDFKWDIRNLQRKLKKLGVTPPPPKGKPVLADIMKPGKFYAHPTGLAALEAYFTQLSELAHSQGSTWTADAFLHNVLGAALASAPKSEQLARPHGHVAARPVIDNRGYLSAALLAAEHVKPFVKSGELATFERSIALGRKVLAGEEFNAKDEALLRELPHVRQRSGAHSRDFTATSPALRAAQGVVLEAEQAATNNVAGKGAREACARAAQLLTKPGEARRFLEKLDALIQLEDAKLQFSKVTEKASAPIVSALWRGAEKGKSSHWLVKLENGRYALLWKVKGKWRLIEGTKDDALASVPDGHLKDAVNALSERAVS
jgi:hypothetical protein